MKKLSAKLLLYDSSIEQIMLYNFKNFSFSSKDLYYIRLIDKRLKRLTGTFLKLRPLVFYYETEQGLKWSAWSVKKASAIKADNVLMIRFKIEGVYYDENELLKNSKLKGFGRVIDDNEYFSAIPLINELTHFDNGVITSVNHKISVDMPETYHDYYVSHPKTPRTIQLLENWDKFSLSLATSYNDETKLKMVGGSGHTHL